MEDKKLNEAESLELISQMIAATRKNVGGGRGNAFLVYGYTALAISVVIFIAVKISGNSAWNALWFLMFVPALVMRLRKREKPSVVTYTDSMINKIWLVCSVLCAVTAVAIPAIGLPLCGVADFSLMLPLCLIYYCMGACVTGLVIKEKFLTWMPVLGVLAAIFMLLENSYGDRITIWWSILFGLIIFTGIIPGHILNSRK